MNSQITPYGPATRAFAASGDILCVIRGGGPLAQAARWGQALRPELRPWALVNHVCWGVGDDRLVEATASGIHYTPVAAYDAADVRVIHDPEITDTQRHEAREYAREQVGDRYNFLDIPPLAFFLVTGFRSEIATGWAQTCSELVANCLWHCEISLGKRPATVLPADIAKHFALRIA